MYELNENFLSAYSKGIKNIDRKIDILDISSNLSLVVMMEFSKIIDEFLSELNFNLAQETDILYFNSLTKELFSSLSRLQSKPDMFFKKFYWVLIFRLNKILKYYE